SSLFPGDAVRQVARLVDVLAELDRDVIREQLQHDRVQDRRRGLFNRRHLENVGRHTVERAVALRDQREHRGVARGDLVYVADHLFLRWDGRADDDVRDLVVEYVNGPVLQLAAGRSFGVDVRDFLQL